MRSMHEFTVGTEALTRAIVTYACGRIAKNAIPDWNPSDFAHHMSRRARSLPLPDDLRAGFVAQPAVEELLAVP
jgi:hypothetical protein